MVRSKPTDQKLYDRVKKRIYAKMPFHSAFRSGHLVKSYKQAFKRKHGARLSPYMGGGKGVAPLKRWFREKWRNENAGTGYKTGTIYRPTVRVNSKTPTTMSELTKREIKRAIAEKRRTGRVKKFKPLKTKT